ncbi:hypothetical protein SASPL_111776 [Salvia splendens]|uniref:SHSP domain-containing protein n=1 Tax=Salvia splendens TaxID=180675 RepID=A0A8X8Y705_SALSN|nr:18.1 kDa class I heat shock protein-like [Salvia splendens]KAG6427530.1 hypothetical protein SASPL_111776 [Salvia splendens]
MSLIPQILAEVCPAFNAAPVDWKETAKAHVLKADLPGLKKEEVKVEVEDGGRVLHISGERPGPQEEKREEERWHRLERPRGSFRRRFHLPENAKSDEVKAAIENGVLILTIPKKEIKKPQVKQIEIVDCK